MHYCSLININGCPTSKGALQTLKSFGGFTAPELLLAIAIVAVLAVLIFSGAKGVRQKADASRCAQQLRQLATAGILYANERGGRLPDRTAWASVVQANAAYSLLPYLNIPIGNPTESYIRTTVLTCPAAQRQAPSRAELHRTYAINQWAAGTSRSETNSWESTVIAQNAPLRLQAAQLSSQAFFMDGPLVDDGGGQFRYSIYQRPDRIDYRISSNWRTQYHHGDAILVAFLDGRVDRITKADADRGLIGLSNGTPSPRTHPFWGAGR